VFFYWINNGLKWLELVLTAAPAVRKGGGCRFAACIGANPNDKKIIRHVILLCLHMQGRSGR
jgi:hypothetical protein